LSFLSAGLEFALTENKNYALMHDATEKNAFGRLECTLIGHTGGKLTACSALLPVGLQLRRLPVSMQPHLFSHNMLHSAKLPKSTSSA